ncbi:MAG: hypothetical protein GQ562_02950 [Anaerolineales bacterium]|nr:hypothetical protein [Anaerolineales bacterium]
MKKLLKEIKDDANFIKSHTLQPEWYKIFKVFMILGFLAGYLFFFGPLKTIVFSGVFFSLSLLVHLAYRIKTNKWTQGWLDFVIAEENGEPRPKGIGKYYYSAVVVNTLIALLISQTMI